MRYTRYYMLGLIISLFMYCHDTYAGGIVKIELPKGVSIELPSDWVVMSKNQVARLNEITRQQYSRLDLTNILFPLSEFPFAANYYYDNKIVTGMVNIRYYPYLDITQDDSRRCDDSELKALDSEIFRSIKRDMDLTNDTFLVSWEGTRKISINNATVFLSEYRRNAQTSKGYFRVRLVRVFNGDKSFTLTVSYHESVAFLMQPMTDRIINSLRIDS